MSIQNIRISHCRILTQVELTPSDRFNLITGVNGSGKSSLLEAISLLATGRSFRGSTIASVIQHGASSLIVSAQVKSASGTLLSVGMERGRQLRRLQINQTPVQRLSEFAEQLPLQIITPESIDLVMGPPKGRRSFIDWGMFHVEPHFLRLSLRYRKTLRHRNALLKQMGRSGHNTNELPHWSRLLTEAGEAFSRERLRYIQQIEQLFNIHIVEKIPMLDGLSIRLRYRQGWSESLSLAEALHQSRERERLLCHTTVGPHEADLLITTDGGRAREVLSRGQAKLLSIGLYLAQLHHLQETSGKQGVVLVDDLFSELDLENSLSVFHYLIESGYQVFATSATTVPALSDHYPIRRFHVEHGSLRVVDAGGDMEQVVDKLGVKGG